MMGWRNPLVTFEARHHKVAGLSHARTRSGPMEGTPAMPHTAPTLSLRSAGDLVAALPYLLGYQPRDALVLACLRAGRVCLTACQALSPDEQLPPALDALLAGIAKADPEGVIVLGYEERTPMADATRHAAMACAEVGVRVHDAMVVAADGWRSLETGCSGPLTEAPASLAELVGAGVSPLASRDALPVSVAEGPEAQAVQRHITRYVSRENAEELLGLYVSAWPLVLDVGNSAPNLTPKTAARAVLALRDVTVRDLVVARLTPGTLAVDDVPGTAGALLRNLPPPAWESATGWDRVRAENRLQHRLTRLAAMTPDAHAAAVLSVLACYAWWHGNGALTRVAIERALQCDPEYRLAQLLERMLDLNVRPPR